MWTCPNCERELKNPNQWHFCGKVSVDSLFEGKPDELVLVFDRLLSEISGWNSVSVSATKNCIVFVHNQTFFVVKPMKKQLDLKFYSNEELTNQVVLKSIAYSGKFENHIRISTLSELSPSVYALIKESYQLL